MGSKSLFHPPPCRGGPFVLQVCGAKSPPCISWVLGVHESGACASAGKRYTEMSASMSALRSGWRQLSCRRRESRHQPSQIVNSQYAQLGQSVGISTPPNAHCLQVR